jgi:hypothetical protein
MEETYQKEENLVPSPPKLSRLFTREETSVNIYLWFKKKETLIDYIPQITKTLSLIKKQKDLTIEDLYLCFKENHNSFPIHFIVFNERSKVWVNFLEEN